MRLLLRFGGRMCRHLEVAAAPALWLAFGLLTFSLLKLSLIRVPDTFESPTEREIAYDPRHI